MTSTSDQGPRAGDRVGGYRLLEHIPGHDELETPLFWAADSRYADAEVPTPRLLLAVLGGTADESRDRLAERYDRTLTLSRIDHAGILPLLDSASPELPESFVCWQAGEARSLRPILDAGGLPIGQSLRLARSLAEAVAAFHARAKIHGSLAVAGILVEGVDRARLAAPGLGSFSLRPGAPAALGRYRAPEQLPGGNGVVDARSDVFAIGAILYELVNGEPPFPLDDLEKLRAAALAGPPPCSAALFGGALAGSLPPDLEQLLARCLQPNPQDRFVGAGQVVGEIDQLLPTFGERSPAATSSSTRSAGHSSTPAGGLEETPEWRQLTAQLSARRKTMSSKESSTPWFLWALPAMLLIALLLLVVALMMYR